ncbi:unnamed protein product [Fraxinus pennsylvanica]|uniref:Late embryogenesis abundant protein LEA-2 subgroup domain-containing protein n=1 Tax=Fraxinus pennsylvanica TaxID=56036 RepID=A0AAD1ZZ98_9LAMI|nr:unnamed protein product [Fraxinus pennsylvanica]
MHNSSDIENSGPIKDPVTKLVRCLGTTLILLLLALTAFSLIVWLILHPSLPEFHVKSLSVSNASISMEFTVENPSWKVNLRFSGFEVVLLHKNCEISRGFVEDFSLSSGKRMKVKWINGGIKRGKMKMDFSKKQVNFDVKMNGVAWFRAGKWINQEKSVQVLCKNLKVEFTNNVEGNLLISTGEIDCSVFSPDS